MLTDIQFKGKMLISLHYSRNFYTYITITRFIVHHLVEKEVDQEK